VTGKTFTRKKFVVSGTVTVSGIAAPGFQSLGLSSFKDDIARVGVVGTSSMATGLASLKKEIKGMEIVACCDVIPEHLQNGM